MYLGKVKRLSDEVKRFPTPENVFYLGLYVIVSDRKRGERLINQAIEMGYLHLQLDKVHNGGHDLQYGWNQNPLFKLNQRIGGVDIYHFNNPK